MASEKSRVLTYVRWYSHTAVYLGDQLIFWDESPGGFGLLQRLGYEIKNHRDVPTHEIPPEFEKGEQG